MAKGRYNSNRGKREKPKRFIVVATEGKKTEKIYLDAFKPPRDSAVQLKVLPNLKDKTPPKEVLQRLKTYARENYVGPDDELWIMIDRDSWPEKDLHDVAKEAKALGFHVALSNPCVEYWFYLHLREDKPFNDRHQLPGELEKLLGTYEKGNFDSEKLAKQVDEAIARAEKLAKGAKEAWPKKQGSSVYRLMKSIIGK